MVYLSSPLSRRLGAGVAGAALACLGFTGLASAAALAAGNADVKSGVSITLSVNGTDDLSSGLSLKFDRANVEISQEISGEPVVLSYDEFKSASLTFGENFNGENFNGGN